MLGIEPRNVAEAARARRADASSRSSARDSRASSSPKARRADLIVGEQRARPGARPQRLRRRASASCSPRTASSTLEFPHLVRLIDGNQFDTIYHEHFSYFSFLTRRAVFAAHGLESFDVEELPTHGGSLRIYAQSRDDDTQPVTAARATPCARARRGAGYDRLDDYAGFGRAGRGDEAAPARVPDRRSGVTASSVAGYGAPGQGQHAAQLLRHPHATSSTTPSTATRTSRDASCPARTSRSIAPERIAETRPDYILILPWNLKDEIVASSRTSASGERSSSSRSRSVRGAGDEGRALLRRSRAADARRLGAHPEADGAGREHADPVAHHEVLRALRAQRVHPLPRATRPT